MAIYGRKLPNQVPPVGITWPYLEFDISFQLLSSGADLATPPVIPDLEPYGGCYA